MWETKSLRVCWVNNLVFVWKIEHRSFLLRIGMDFCFGKRECGVLLCNGLKQFELRPRVSLNMMCGYISWNFELIVGRWVGLLSCCVGSFGYNMLKSHFFLTCGSMGSVCFCGLMALGGGNYYTSSI